MDPQSSPKYSGTAAPAQSLRAQGQSDHRPLSPENNAPVDPAQPQLQTQPKVPPRERSYFVRDSLSPDIVLMANMRPNRQRNIAAENRFYNRPRQRHIDAPSSLAPPPILLPLPPLPRPLPSHKHPRDGYRSESEVNPHRKKDKGSKRESKKRRLSAPAVAPSPLVTAPPPKPRYVIARKQWDRKLTSSPWSPLTPGLASISGETPFSAFPRSRFLCRATGTRDLSPSPLVTSNPSHPSLEHPSSPPLAVATTPLQPALSPVVSAIETVVQPPTITVLHLSHSLEHHPPVLQPLAQQQQHSALPLPVSVPGSMAPPPPLPIQSPQQVQAQVWARARAQAEVQTEARAQAQPQAQAQKPAPPPPPPPPPSRLIRFLEHCGGSYVAEQLLVHIHIRESNLSKNLYSVFVDLSNEQGLKSVNALNITLDWSWTKRDLERLAAAVRGCRFTTLVVNGGKSRPQLRDRAASSDAIPATLFDPLIQLFDFKPLTHIYLVNMPDCLQKFSVDFPGDLSHLEVLQVHLDIFNWEYLHGRTVYRLVSRLSHVTLLIVECPLEGYRAYLMNIWYALKAPSTALISTTSITPPSQDIEVQLFSRGKIHAKAVFRRQGAVPKSLMVDLNFDLRCEVIWQYILNSTIAHNIHTFHLDRAPSNGWFPIVLNWLENRQHQAISSSSSTVSTSATNSTAPAAASSRININNATTTFVHLREISLCCFRLRADSERYLIELIKIATSPTLGLRCLRLVGLRLPLKSSHGINLGNQDGNSLTWSRLFIRSALWNLEEFEIRDSDFGDKHVEGFLLFMENTKTMEENERTKRRDREEEQEKRKGQLELGLITLEDGEMEEVADDSDIVSMRLNVVRILNHLLTPVARSYLLGKIQAMQPPVKLYLGPSKMNK